MSVAAGNSSRFTFGFAEPADDARLRAILRRNEMEGAIPDIKVDDMAGVRSLVAAMREVAELASKTPQGEATDNAMERMGESAEIIYDLLEKRRRERKSA